MERVAFLIEDTGERIGCLLNPESLVVRRQAGVRARRSAGGLVTGADLADDQLLYSGGGNTELTMNLLFDVSLAGSSIADGRRPRPDRALLALGGKFSTSRQLRVSADLPVCVGQKLANAGSGNGRRRKA